MVRLLSHILTAQFAFATAFAARPSVTIASGVVVGTTTTLPSASRPVNKYIGVPFAKSPPERFSPPQEHPSWTTPIQAVETKPNCMQQFGNRKSTKRELQVFYYPAGPPPTESEDCMYLNVYAPPSASPKNKKAVLFYIFGGNQQFGSGGFHFFDGASFAHYEDVVVVAPNARTNVFGFPGSPEIPKNKQNVGLLDFRFALEWVQHNIAKFGGDPSRVTIFGESSGATNVKHLIAMPPKPLTFNSAIIQSDASDNLGDNARAWKALVKQQNCTKAASPLECIRKKPAKELKNAIQDNRLAFPPTVDQETYTTDIRPFVQAGTAAKVPIIVGTTSEEGRAFAYQMGLQNPGATLSQFLSNFFPGRKLLQTILKTKFPLGAEDAPYLAASKIITDSIFTCRTSALADYLQSHGYQIHRYFYNAKFPNLGTFPKPGVYHSSDISMVFGTYPRKGHTQQQTKFSRFLQKTWANFAKNSQKDPGWPVLGSTGNVGELEVASGVKTIKASDVDQDCPVFALLIDAKGL